MFSFNNIYDKKRQNIDYILYKTKLLFFNLPEIYLWLKIYDFDGNLEIKQESINNT